MTRPVQKALALAAAPVAALALAGPAAAHGTLSPSTGATGTSQRFELTVPNARLDADIAAVSLALPEGAVLVSAEAEQPRWAVMSDEQSVRWSGGPIDRGGAETFAFTVQLPDDPGQAEFTLVESFDDGDGAPFPIPVAVIGEAGGSSSAETLAAVALVVAVLALLAATAALALALRSRSRSNT